MQTAELVVGVITLLLIGFGHWWVKWLLRHVGFYSWLAVAVIGMILVTASFFAPDVLVSALLGVAGFTTLWGAYEIIQHRTEFSLETNH